MLHFLELARPDDWKASLSEFEIGRIKSTSEVALPDLFLSGQLYHVRLTSRPDNSLSISESIQNGCNGFLRRFLRGSEYKR
jgi:hypothetical protein